MKDALLALLVALLLPVDRMGRQVHGGPMVLLALAAAVERARVTVGAAIAFLVAATNALLALVVVLLVLLLAMKDMVAAASGPLRPS